MSPIPCIRSELLARFPSVVFGMSTRQGADHASPFGMNLSFSVGDEEEYVRRNRQKFFESVGVDMHRLAIPRQVHSATVGIADKPGAYDACDALISNAREVFLCVSVADCVPVFLLDAAQGVVAAIHAGWRGSAQRIAEKTVERMAKEFASKPEELLAFIGPAAGVCCYTVGDEVAARFDSQLVEHRDGHRFLDLKKANLAHLRAAGVPQNAIETSPFCTITEEKLLHSYRRDRDRSGRMMGVIGLI